MRLDCPACPPGASRSTITVRSPSDAPYTAAASPGRPAADDDQVVVLGGGLRRDAEPLGELEHGRPLEHGAVLQQRDRQAALLDAGDREQLARLAVALDVEPARGHAVAREEVAQLVGVLREAVADEPHAAGLQRGPGLPRGQQVLHDRVELLLRRIPRLEQVVVQRDLVDRLDRRRRVGVGRQQDALGARDELPSGDEVVGARHPGHPLVGDEQRHLVAAPDELAQQFRAPRRPSLARTIR